MYNLPLSLNSNSKVFALPDLFPFGLNREQKRKEPACLMNWFCDTFAEGVYCQSRDSFYELTNVSTCVCYVGRRGQAWCQKSPQTHTAHTPPTSYNPNSKLLKTINSSKNEFYFYQPNSQKIVCFDDRVSMYVVLVWNYCRHSSVCVYGPVCLLHTLTQMRSFDIISLHLEGWVKYGQQSPLWMTGVHGFI